MAESSIFYNPERLFPIPLIALEYYAHNAKQDMGDEELYDIAAVVIGKYCKVENPNAESFDYFVNRLEEIKAEMDKAMSDKDTAHVKLSFGTQYITHMNTLNIDSTLMMMTSYSLRNAEVLYNDLDRSDVLRLIKDYQAEKLASHTTAMEAVLYGMGGKYKDDGQRSRSSGDDQNERVFDIQSPEGIKRLRELGF